MFSHQLAFLIGGYRFVVLAFALALLASGGVELRAASKSPWQTVSAEELANTAPLVEPGVFAEAVSYKIEIDDEGYPDHRRYRQYVRFKVYEPERAEAILSTRLFDGENESTERKGLKLRARMTLPNGSVTEFDEKAFVERTRKEKAKKGVLAWLFGAQREVKDRMLVISGIEKGAVLEYLLEWKQSLGDYPEMELWPLQFPDVPIRNGEYEHVFSEDRFSGARSIVQLLNPGAAKLKRDKNRITVTAINIKASMDEPYLGPASDYTLMVMNYSGQLRTASDRFMRQEGKRTEYVGADGKKKDRIEGIGPWALLASIYYDRETERAKQTKKVRELAAELTKGMTKDREKAKRLHNFVVELRQKYLKHEKQTVLQAEEKPAKSPDEVLDFAKKGRTYDSMDFLMVDLALYRAAGLDAHLVILPDRTLMRFEKNIVEPSLLDAPCVGVRIDERWYFSSPHLQTPIAFNILPAWNEGQVGLVAWEAKQEFIGVPLTPSSATTVRNTAKLKLDVEGNLSGLVKTSMTGHIATSVRRRLLAESDEQEQKKVARGKLSEPMPDAALEIKAISGLETPEEPVEITYSLKWDGFVAFTKEMFVLRPSVFRPASEIPFTSQDRRYIVSFPFHWQEFDEVYIEVPEGYAPEAPSAPASMPGKELSYKIELSYSPAKRILVLKRQFTSNLAEVPVAQYSILKGWYDDVSARDNHEIVFKKLSRAQEEQKDAPTPVTSPQVKEDSP